MCANNLRLLSGAILIGLSATGEILAADAGELDVELDATEREQLELRIDEARQQLDEAAAKLGELHGALYSMETLGSHGRKPMLGVLLGESGPSGGLQVVGVTPGGGADQAGLKAGDELTTVNDVDLTSGGDTMAGLQRAMHDVEPGQDVTVGYQRDGSLALASVTTQARGVYIMGMTGMPDVDIEIEGVHALEEMTQAMAMTFQDHDHTSEVTKNIEILEMDGSPSSAVSHRSIRLGGGLRLEDVESDLAQYFDVDRGVLVMAVPAAGEAAAAGLEAGDILLAVAGEPIDRARDGYRALLGSDSETVTVDVLRGGVRQSLELKPGDFRGEPHSISIRGAMMDQPSEVDVRVIRPDSR